MKGKRLLILGAAFALGLSACANSAAIVRKTPFKADPVASNVDLSGGTFSTDHITWTTAGNIVTIQQLKGTSSNAVNSSYISAPRLYKGHILSFVAAENYAIKSISITANGSYFGNSITAGTSYSSNVVADNTTDVLRTWDYSNGGTHVISSASDDGLQEIYIQNVASANNVQLRPSALSVTYVSKSSGNEKPATGIELNSTSGSYFAGDTFTLTATVSPSDTTDLLVWSSSNNSVATVNTSGLVTCLKGGTATITATAGSVHANYSLTVNSRSLADYNDATDGTAVDFYAYYVDGYKGSTNTGYFVADGSIAVLVYATAPTGVVEGDILHVSGKIKFYNGLREISPASAEIVASHEGLSSPTTLNLDEDAFSNLSVKDQGRKVSVTGVVTAISGEPAYGTTTVYYTITIGEQSITLQLHKTNISQSEYEDFSSKVSLNKTISFTAHLSYYNAYQLVNPSNVVVEQASQLTGIELNEHALSLEAGETFTLVVSPDPADAELGEVIWESSDDAVAEVDEGIVYARGAGQCTISATSDTFSDECEVTVKAVDASVLKAIMKYTGTTTTNMSGEDNNASLVNLDDSIFTVGADKGETTNFPGLNKDGDIRLYGKASGNGSYFTVSVPSGYTITSIKIDFKQGNSGAKVYSESTLVSGSNGSYSINSSSFTVENGYTATTQVQINSIEISYKEPGASTIIQNTQTTNTTLSYNYNKSGDGVVDSLNYSFTGITGTNYADWSGKTGESGVVYAGQSGGQNSSIQLRSNNDNSGVITTENTTGKTAKAITISWHSATQAERTVEVYGKDSAYTSATDLYDADKRGTLLGTLVYDGTNLTTNLVIQNPTQFIGLKSSSGALYISSLKIQWGDLPSFEYSSVALRFGGLMNKALWDKLSEETTIQGYGVLFSATDALNGAKLSVDNAQHNLFVDSNTKANPSLANDNQKGDLTGDYYIWNLKVNVTTSDKYNVSYTAVAYIKTSDGYVLLKEVTTSVKDLADDYIKNRGYEEDAFDGSLNNLANFN